MTFVAVGPYCFGSGESKKAALECCRSFLPHFCRSKPEDMPFLLYRVSEDWEIDFHGNVSARNVCLVERFRADKSSDYVSLFGGISK